jgi:hypothetical protein
MHEVVFIGSNTCKYVRPYGQDEGANQTKKKMWAWRQILLVDYGG